MEDIRLLPKLKTKVKLVGPKWKMENPSRINWIYGRARHRTKHIQTAEKNRRVRKHERIGRYNLNTIPRFC